MLKKRIGSVFEKYGRFLPPTIASRLGHSSFDFSKYEYVAPRNLLHKYFENKYGYKGELLDIVADTKEFKVNKWEHYLPIYETYFSKFRSEKVRILEIGVSGGGSLNVWRRYFGEEAIIFGIDIDDRCAALDGLDGKVRIGSQADQKFLKAVIDEMGGVDILIDDGSHNMNDIKTSLEFIYPSLSEGGIYLIEDLHTAYWAKYQGGFRRKNNFFNYVSELVEDIHSSYHQISGQHPQISQALTGIHIYDSVVVLEKNKRFEPRHMIYK